MRSFRSAVNTNTPQRWYETKARYRPWLLDPRDWEWYWLPMLTRVIRPVCEVLICAGLLEVEEGDRYIDARIAPLGTAPKPWPFFMRKPWWIRWIK